MKKYIQMVLVLFVISLLSGLLMGFVNDLTKDKIAEYNTIKANKAIAEIYKDFNRVEEITNDFSDHNYSKISKVYKDDTLLGYALQTNAPGSYSGTLDIVMGINVDLTIQGFSTVTSGETPGFGKDALEDKNFVNQFIGLENPDTADIYSGATVTSNAVKNALKKAQEFVIVNLQGGEVVDKVAEILTEVFETADTYETVTGYEEADYLAGIYKVFDKDNEFLGHLLLMDVSELSYSKVLETYIGIDTEDKIAGIAFGDFSETPGIGALVKEQRFIELLLGIKDIQEVSDEDGKPNQDLIDASTEVDATIGSTKSRTAMFEAVKGALVYYNTHLNIVKIAIEDLYPADYTYAVNDDFEADGALVNLYDIKDNDGALAGYVFHIDAPDAYKGYQIFAAITLEGKLKQLAFADIKETAGDKFGQAALKDEAFISQFEGVDDTSDLDIFTGATKTSNALKNGVQLALDYFKANLQE